MKANISLHLNYLKWETLTMVGGALHVGEQRGNHCEPKTALKNKIIFKYYLRNILLLKI